MVRLCSKKLLLLPHLLSSSTMSTPCPHRASPLMLLRRRLRAYSTSSVLSDGSGADISFAPRRSDASSFLEDFRHSFSSASLFRSSVDDTPPTSCSSSVAVGTSAEDFG